MKSKILGILQSGHRVVLRPARARFDRALGDCEAAQTERLRRLLAGNRDSKYGQAHGFGGIDSVRSWQDRVPVTNYDDLESWVARTARGEPGVLTTAPVRFFERTGGSTAANKRIPYTDALLDEFAAATGPWLHNLYESFPELRGTTSYWSISPALRQPERTEGGIPVGLKDDTEYFGPLERLALRRMLAVPPDVAQLKDMETWTDATARHLVAASDLGLISVWHPSFFVLLFRRIENRLDALLDVVSPRRAAAVRDRLGRMPLGEALWPRLAVISCWADAAASEAVPELIRLFPHAKSQPKGLLATEGVISFPLQRGSEAACVAAVTGHFLEFVDLDHPGRRPLLAHELAPDAVYAPLISTGGGFYRYRLGDIVRCTGFLGSVPTLRFEGRMDQVVDLCGEKLNPRMVDAAIAAAEKGAGVTLMFSLLSPVKGTPPHYRLYAETFADQDPSVLGEILERALCASHGYRYARSLGQLGPVHVVPVRDGASRYLRAHAGSGQRLGDVKPARLDARLDWDEVFTEGKGELSGMGAR